MVSVEDGSARPMRGSVQRAVTGQRSSLARQPKTLVPYRPMPPPAASFMVDFKIPVKTPCFYCSTFSSTERP
jgi:hypothetical protein